MTSGAVAKPHAQRSKRRYNKWLQRVLAGLSVLLVVLAGGGLIYQAVATQIDERRLPPPGQLVTVGDDKMQLAAPVTVVPR